MCIDDKHLKHATAPKTTSGQGMTSSPGELTFQFKLPHQLKSRFSCQISE